MNEYLIIGLAFVGLATVILLHHLAKHGYLIDKNDVSSHEFVVGLFGAFGIGAIIGGSVTK